MADTIFNTATRNAQSHTKSSITTRENESALMNGAEILVQSLLDAGVDTIFGYPGGAVLTIYDELFKNSGIRHILVKHEQGATHMADGYARATGKPGVVLVTSGPGATNTVTGIATAHMDSSPLVVLTGQVPSQMIGNDAFQEADIIGITRPITKHSYLVRNVNELARVVKEAFYIATSGKPGPVVIDLPKDMIAQQTSYEPPENIRIRGYNPVLNGHPQQIQRAVRLIQNSKRPLLYIGGGVILGKAEAELKALAEKTSIPVACTLMGVSALPSNHPQNLGMLGMHGTWTANMAISECDLLIAIGARFDDRVTGRLDKFSPRSRKIHIDIEPANIAKNVAVDVPIVGNAKNILPELTREVKPPDIAEWWANIRTWQQKHPLVYEDSDQLIKPQTVIRKISDHTNGEAFIVTDVGQHQMWAAQFYNFSRPRSFISSGGLGTMGFGVPAAIGACLGQPERIIWGIVGDGGFQMTAMELATAVKYRLPVKIALLNNQYLGMVRQWQELFYEKRYAYSNIQDGSPNFVKLVESLGAKGMRVTDPAYIDDAIQKAMAEKDRPVVVEFCVDPEENVFPMVPAGAALYEMIEYSRK